MLDNEKTREQLIAELSFAQERIDALEKEIDKHRHNSSLFGLHLKTLVDSSPIPTFAINTDHIVIYWNKALEIVTGVKSHDVINTNFHWRAFYDHPRPCLCDLIVDGDFEAICKFYNCIFCESQLVSNAYEVMDFFPSLGVSGRWLHFTAALIKDSCGKTIGAIETLQDFTSLKLTGQLLRQSEERFRALVHQAQDAIFVSDLSGRFLMVNQKACNSLEYSNPELLALAVADVDPYFPTGEAAKEILESLPRTFESRHLKKNRTSFPVEVSLSIINLYDQQVILAVVRDITDRILAEEALKETQEKYRIIVDTANEGIMSINSDLQVTYANNVIAQMLGYSVEEIRTLRFSDFIFSEDLPLHRDEIGRRMKGVSSRFERRFKRKDGEEVWTIFAAEPLVDNAGNYAGAFGMFTDITERKLIEEELAQERAVLDAIFNSVPGLLYMYDDLGMLIRCNSRHVDITGYSLIELSRMHYLDFFKNDEVAITEIQNAVSGIYINSFGHAEAEIQTKCGDKIPFYFTGTLLDFCGKKYFTGIGIDISERKHAEAALSRMNRDLEILVAERTLDLERKAMELEDANHQLREMDRLKNAFLSSVSHELRTPLTAVLGFSKLILRDFQLHFLGLAATPTLLSKGNRIRENLSIINQEGDRLTRLINDMLDLSKIESGEMTWRDKVVRPNDLIIQMVNAASGLFAQNRNVKIDLNLDSSLPEIFMDQDRLAQVLMNLLDNAVKFTHEGLVEVETSTTENTLLFRVSDTGIGIPDGERSQIFHKFHQVANEELNWEKPKGTGLGLSICKQIVEHYGGRIWVESSLGQGSTFYFELPISLAAKVHKN